MPSKAGCRSNDLVSALSVCTLAANVTIEPDSAKEEDELPQVQSGLGKDKDTKGQQRLQCG